MNQDAFFSPAPLTREELQRMPLFPLPATTLFPKTFLPLHIFEPRYRVMVSTAIKEGGALGVVMLQSGESADGNKPRVHRVAGCGRIVHHNELADGRYMILVRGMSRVSVEKEIATDEPFRRFMVNEIREEEMSGEAATEAMATMNNFAMQIAIAMTEGGPELLKAVSMTKVPGELADLLASALIGVPEVQQSLLETHKAEARVERVVSTMAELLLSMATDKPESGLDN